ncbi:MAG TPA: putative Ig domain-containing protein, partial [Myxococcaceae bacterium]|nr:putative Ig domain-containing protein [Myxococcaceae bacterium]
MGPPTQQIASAPATAAGWKPEFWTVSLNLSVFTALRITTTALSDAYAGSGFTATLSATGGQAPFSWTFTGLPAGINAAASGLLSGTPTAAGSFGLIVTVADGSGQTVSQPLTLDIYDPPSLPAAALADGIVNGAYSQLLQATGGKLPYTFTVAAGALPAGLSLATNGSLSGTPTASGSFPFTAQVADGNNRTAVRTFTLNVFAGVAVTTATLPDGYSGTAYNQTLGAAGGRSPYTWVIASGSLPAGLALSSGGLISGTPSATGTFSFDVRVTDSATPAATSVRSLGLTVHAAPAIGTASLEDGYTGSAYSQTLSGTGGRAPYTFAVTTGALPPGLTLSSGGVLSGTPTATGTNNLTFTLSDANGVAVSRSLTLAVFAPVAVSTSSLPTAYPAVAYSASLVASGGKAPITWTLTAGALAPGLSLSTAGTITGTPTAAGAYTFTVQASDANGRTGSRALTITVDPSLVVTTANLADGYTGTAYSAALAATGGRAPYTFTITGGALPNGLTLSTSGAITGTPTSAGVASFTVQVTDANGSSATSALSLGVYAPPSVSTSALADGYVGSAYNSSVSVTGGKAPFSWTHTSGVVPPGLAMDTSGNVTGTPTTPGAFPFTVRVTDGNGITASRQVSLEILGQLSVTTATLPDGYAGSAYSATLAATGGRGPYSWSITAGALPAGLALSTAGALSGTPTATGNFSFTVRATDANGRTDSKALALAVVPALGITTASLADGYTGAAYTGNVVASGGRAPYTFAVSAGALPAGISLSTSGVLSGTPTATGSANFTAQVTDANGVTSTQALTLGVYPAVAVTTSALADGYTGVAYSASLSATGGKAPLSWSVTGGALPAGVSLSAAGALSGTPTATGAASFTVRAADANGVSSSAPLTITVFTPPAITTSALPNGDVAVAYNAPALAATGGKSPLTWSISSGSLPTGLSLSASSGSITGTPSAGGAFTFTATVTDANGRSDNRALSISITGALAVATVSLPDGYTGAAYSAALSASGGRSPYSFSVPPGSLPSGLGLSAAGVFSGTPSATGTTTFTVTVTDANSSTATRNLSITVFTQPTVTTATLPDGYTNTAYSGTVAATGGKAPYTFALVGGSLPNGISLSGSGALAGTPTAAGTSSFTVQVTDANGIIGTRALSIAVLVPPSVSTTTLPDGYAGSAYSATLAATGGKAPYTWSIVSGQLPTGLTLSSSGTISGTPSSPVAGAATVQVTDANGVSVTQPISLIIYAAPAVTTASLADGYEGVAYSATLAASGGKAPLTWSVSTGSLPTGLSLSSGGALSGTPTAAINGSFSVTVSDANGRTSTRMLTLTVYAQPAITTASFADAYAGTAYSATAAATGGKAPLSWAVSAGALPAGLGLSAAGVISGTPTAAGTASFTLRVTDANGVGATRALTLAVFTAISVSTSSLADGYAGTAYSATLSATGGQAPYSWSITAGALPGGLTLSTSGSVAGTPTAAGSSSFTVQVTDANGASATRALTINIFGALTITTASFADGYANASYNAPAAATGGRTPYTWSVTSGSLPAGLTLVPSTGAIQGTPSTSGTSAFSLSVVDVNGVSASRALSIVIYRLPTIANTSLVSGVEGVTYRVGPNTPEQIVGQDGKAPLAYTAGNLPPGLVISGTTGVISGIPAQGSAGVYSINAVVTDANGRTVSKTLSLTVQAAQPITGGGVAGVEPSGSPITDALTVFVMGTGNRMLPGIGVRVRKNGAEYSPVKQVLTDANGKAFFSGLGLNGTTDTVDITINGTGIANSTMAKVNGALVTMIPYDYPTPLGRHQAASSYDPTVGRVFVANGAADYFYAPYGCSNDVLRYQGSTNAWTEVIPAGLLSGPATRIATQMAYGGGLNVLFGGADCFTGALVGDTWELNGTTGSWTAG